jgi:transcriptional regulator with XRE-family HTH domain
LPLAHDLIVTSSQPITAARLVLASALFLKVSMYSDNFMTIRYNMYLESASGNTKCGVVFLDSSCILKEMKWYEKAKRLMTIKKIRQEDLIDVFGVTTRGAVGHYLTGRRQPDPDQMKALADKLDCTLDELLTQGEPDPVQTKINNIIRSAELAMKSSTHEFTESERLRVFRMAFSAGLDENITDDELISYLEGFVRK